MSQMSLFDCDYTRFAGVMPAVRAAMRRAAGAPDSIGRKGLVDKINLIAGEAEIRLTGGQGTSISKDTLDKWLSPSDTSHPPSVLAVLVFCRACEDFEALRVIVRAVGMDLMTPEDRRLRDYAEADLKMREARKWKKDWRRVMSRRRAGTPITRAELGALRCRVAKRIYEALQRKGARLALWPMDSAYRSRLCAPRSGVQPFGARSGCAPCGGRPGKIPF